MEYDFNKIEKKWQKKWEDKKIFEVSEKTKKPKFYCLEMFPYPSASGLHMGHALNYSIGDIYARFKRMNGFNVLYPMGFDALGLPAENAAIKAGEEPKPFTEKAIKNYIRQMKEIGLSYDWNKTVSTLDPEYYKWNQFFFLKFLENGLVYRKKAAVNWCPKCNTVLANEQVHSGKCWRHEDTDVEIKQLEQWFIKTTKYADELLEDLEKLDWPERIKIMQRNWIGKSNGTEILFEVNGQKWPIFTTRPDTLFGVTFMVVSAQHPRLMELIKDKQKKNAEKFLKKLKGVSEKQLEEMDKEGVFTGSYAKHPLLDKEVPIYAGNFVVADYGSGMVMAVPAHDQRDYEFALKYSLPIKQVIRDPENEEESASEMKEAYTGEGVLINSEEFNDLDSEEAKVHITKVLQSKKIGKNVVNYKLRDWLVSRQRYWGTPIPIIYCDKCGIVPVPEKDLPIKLPEKVKFGKGNPLLTNKEWVNVKCPKCGEKARRETDTMDTFFDSSWYYLRYCDNQNNKKPFEKKKVDYWMPVDQYIGGAEHACMHLIYARFFTKALRDLKFLDFDEPFISLFNQGMLHGEDGEKMSKSREKYAVLPETVSDKYGIDTARFFLFSVASPDKDTTWSEDGINGSFKFINKIMEYFKNVKIIKKDNAGIENKLNKTIKEVTNQLNEFKYNLALINLRNLFNYLPKEVAKDTLGKFLQLLAPFCPHIAEELWEKLGHKDFISLSEWPKADEKKINPEFDKIDEAGDKIVADIMNILKIIEARKEKKEKVYVYVLPKEKEFYNEDEISKRVGKTVKIFAVNDKNKYDPTNKSKNTKPNKPGIYLE